MDACHVLLRRPWQYDRHVIHDGYFNTYSFYHNNRKIVLTPITPTSTSSKTTTTLSTILQSEYHEYASFKDHLLLGLDEEEKQPQPLLSPVIQTLFKAYALVFPDEIPMGLPPP